MIERRALIWLGSTERGGLSTALPSGTRSLLLYFAQPSARQPFGAVITTEDASELAPDETQTAVTLQFWADEAGELPQGSVFAVWYSRFVGVGRLE